jgi:hypothetical protein
MDNTKFPTITYYYRPKGRRDENLKVSDHLGDLDVDERMVLKWALNKYGEKV